MCARFAAIETRIGKVGIRRLSVVFIVSAILQKKTAPSCKDPENIMKTRSQNSPILNHSPRQL